MEGNIFRGQIYYASLWKGGECVQKGQRPVIIVSNNKGNNNSGIVLVVPVTSKKKPSLPTHFEFMSQKIRGTALCEQLCCISKDDLGDCAGALPRYFLSILDRCLSHALDLEGRFSGDAPPVSDIEVENQVALCKKLQSELEKNSAILSGMLGRPIEDEIPKVVELPVPKKTLEVVSKRQYKKRTPQEIFEFIKEWECSSNDRKEVAQSFGFNTYSTAQVFYSRHKEDFKK